MDQVTDKKTKKMLMSFVEKSTKLISSDPNFYRFHWQYGPYKFNNIHLVYWFEKEHNCYVEFVDKKFDFLKQKLLEVSEIDEKLDYDLIYLTNLRKNNSRLGLFFSGGYDSTYLFKKAIDNNIFFDKIASATVHDVNLPYAEEIKYNVIPWLKKYPKSYGNYLLREVPLDEYRNYIKDKTYIFEKNMYHIPSHIMLQWMNFPEEPDLTYIRCTENPMLVYKNKKWYATIINKQLGESQFIKNLSYFWLDPENIKSFLKNAFIIKNYIIENKKLTDLNTQFFKIKTEEIYDLLNYPMILNKEKQSKKTAVSNNNNSGYIRSDKDVEFIKFLASNHEELLIDYYRGMSYFNEICNISTENVSNVNSSSGKFPWLIDLEDFKIYKQSDIFK